MTTVTFSADVPNIDRARWVLDTLAELDVDAITIEARLTGDVQPVETVAMEPTDAEAHGGTSDGWTPIEAFNAAAYDDTPLTKPSCREVLEIVGDTAPVGSDGGLLTSELGEAYSGASSSIKSILRELYTKGLVERRPNNTDTQLRYEYEYRLTDAGAASLADDDTETSVAEDTDERPRIKAGTGSHEVLSALVMTDRPLSGHDLEPYVSSISPNSVAPTLYSLRERGLAEVVREEPQPKGRDRYYYAPTDAGERAIDTLGVWGDGNE